MILNMNLTKIRPYARFALLLGILLIIILGVLIVRSAVREKPTRYSPTPPTLNPVKLTQSPDFASELAKIKSALPYQGPNFSIEYLEPVNILSVKISAKTKDDYSQTKTKAEEYLKSRGVTNLCTLNIFWVPIVDQPLRKSLNAQDLLTTTCPSRTISASPAP